MNSLRRCLLHSGPHGVLALLRPLLPLLLLLLLPLGLAQDVGSVRQYRTDFHGAPVRFFWFNQSEVGAGVVWCVV